MAFRDLYRTKIGNTVAMEIDNGKYLIVRTCSPIWHVGEILDYITSRWEAIDEVPAIEDQMVGEHGDFLKDSQGCIWFKVTEEHPQGEETVHHLLMVRDTPSSSGRGFSGDRWEQRAIDERYGPLEVLPDPFEGTGPQRDAQEVLARDLHDYDCLWTATWGDASEELQDEFRSLAREIIAKRES